MVVVVVVAGTRKGKAVAVLADSLEVFDATRGGFLRDRSIQNGRCVGAMTRASVCVGRI
jgi:hypothetical protein